MAIKRFNAHVTTGNATGVGAGSAVSGSTLFIGRTYQKVRNLAAQVVATAVTTSLTYTARWQGSNDGSTWYTVTNGPQNASGVALTSGTQVGIEAAEGVYSYAFGRCQLVVGAATGATQDTYSIGYNYLQMDPGTVP